MGRSAAQGGFRHFSSRPRRIVLIRHGQSVGNVDESAYVTTADWRIPLTDRGREQAFSAGKTLKGLIGEKEVFFYVSPYLRTAETLREVVKHIKPSFVVGIRGK